MITRKQFINHAVLPGLRPRLKELFASGFHYIPFFLALVYQAVRLLPASHPYLNARNIGHYGIRHVIAEASNNLVISVRNIDQLILFVTILFGMGIIFFQLAIFAFSLFAGPVMATMPTNFAGFFITPAADAPQDLAYIMLDLVFGVPDIFGSCVDPAVGVDCVLDVRETSASSGSLVDPWAGLSFPFPIHVGLHQMFAMYSTGLLVVATFITVYFAITIAIETAQTGTAFGKRFNKVWAPIRLVVAFGLLIPVGYGLNSSQYIVLYAAKLGSGFATNGWKIFNDSLTGTYLGDQTTLVSRPNVPEIGGFVQFMFVARTCAEMYERSGTHEFPTSTGGGGTHKKIEPYLVRDPVMSPSFLMLNTAAYGDANRPFTSYEDMINFANGAKSVTLRFGYRGEDENFANAKGGVSPKCGELTIPLNDPRTPGSATSAPEIAAEVIQRYYWFMIQDLWYIHFFDIEPAFGTYVGENLPLNFVDKYYQKNSTSQLPGSDYASDLLDFMKRDLDILLDGAPYGTTNIETYITEVGTGIVNEQAQSPVWNADQSDLSKKGWAGAGIWYNKLAELNGIISMAIQAVPSATRFPQVMEDVKSKKEQYNAAIQFTKQFDPKLANNRNVPLSEPGDEVFQPLLNEVYQYWASAGVNSAQTTVTGNALIDAINALIGADGLYSMRKNPDVHPLAQLVGLGRSLVEASIRNLTISVGGAGVSALLGEALGKHVGTLGATAVGFLMTIVTISLTMGFVLFYVIPFMPFIYFFFAMGGWVKGIFEAMVGAPLWALAHIRIDGNGLSGQAAVNGYFLIFEIFLRPILILFGFLASISILSALVLVLNQTWDIVTANLGGFDAGAENEVIFSGVGEQLLEISRGPIDEFLYTVMYTIIVYLMAMSSFKLIDLIPNNILRWMGQSVATFNDSRDDPAAGLVGTATLGANQSVNSVGGGLKTGLQGIASSGGNK